MVIEFKDDLYKIVDFKHVKPGKGQAYVRTELKSLTSGKVLKHKFNAGEEFEAARVENRPFQFLYKDESGYHFMDQESFEQINVSEDLIDHPEYIKDGTEVELQIHTETGKPVACKLPPFVELEVSYTEPGIKGDTATSATKDAELETGATVQVPLFIEQGEKVKIDTRKHEYVERAKS
jgi:elongation factor P